MNKFNKVVIYSKENTLLKILDISKIKTKKEREDFIKKSFDKIPCADSYELT